MIVRENPRLTGRYYLAHFPLLIAASFVAARGVVLWLLFCAAVAMFTLCIVTLFCIRTRPDRDGLRQRVQIKIAAINAVALATALGWDVFANAADVLEGYCVAVLVFGPASYGVTAAWSRAVNWLLARHRHFVDARHCRKCGYDLTGNVSGRCPECGAPVDGDGMDNRRVVYESEEQVGIP